MRGFNVGDTLTTQDRQHKGVVTKIKFEKDDFKITINENGTEYTDSIQNFIII